MTLQTATVITSIADIRVALADARQDGRTISFVPTMGALHDGHLALIGQAREVSDLVVVSIFVNPTQFNDASDLEAYPRDLERDTALAAAAGADVIFAPTAGELYPDGFCTEVRVTGPLTETLEGAHRGAAHFHGVTTVVTKLLSIVGPDTAVFGAKDAQQVRVIERLVRDLHLPVQIVRGQTVREADGLARSSRNARLAPEARAQAAAISQALAAARQAHASGQDDADALLHAARSVLAAHNITPEYLALCDAVTLEPLDRLTPATGALVLLAATVGGVRLIDNIDLPSTTTHNPES